VTGIARHPWGPRLYVAGRRVHHGSAGCVLALAGLARRDLRTVAVGAAMIAHDVRDFPWRDTDNHEPGH